MFTRITILNNNLTWFESQVKNFIWGKKHC